MPPGARRLRAERRKPGAGPFSFHQLLARSTCLRALLCVGEHIVDFACTRGWLVVEVEGSYHEQRTRHDRARDRALNGLGWHVVRVLEHHVFGQLDEVVASITESAQRQGLGRP